MRFVQNVSFRTQLRYRLWFSMHTILLTSYIVAKAVYTVALAEPFYASHVSPRSQLTLFAYTSGLNLSFPPLNMCILLIWSVLRGLRICFTETGTIQKSLLVL